MTASLPQTAPHIRRGGQSRSAGSSFPRPKIGLLFVLCIPLGASVALSGGIEIAGFSYTGWLWMLELSAGMLLLATDRALHRTAGVAFPFGAWLPWVGFVWLSLAWVDGLSRRHVQEAIQITMPVLMGAIASVFVRTEQQLALLLRTFRWSLVPLAICLMLANLNDVGGKDLSNSLRPLGIAASLIACVFLAQMPAEKTGPVLGWSSCALLNFFSGARTITIGLIALLLLNPLFKGFTKRMILGVVLCALSLAVFYTPQFQSRFFHSGHGSLSDLLGDDMQGSGRFDAWPSILKEACRRPVLGAGVGSAYAFVPTVWEDIHQVHNDYLRIAFELGLAGLAIFVPTFCVQTARLWRLTQTTYGANRAAFAAAFLGMLVLAINACTDNPLGYNVWFTDPLFVLMGAAYGVSQNAERPESRWTANAEEKRE